MSVLEVSHLTKKFGNFIAVNDISFNLKEGEILGFLGRNGAGKTTTIQMLLGALTPTLGSVSYFGKSIKNHREEILEQVNFSSTYTNLPWTLTVKENLNFISYLYNIVNRRDRINKLIKIFNLQELCLKQMRELSAGQITRVSLAKSFINFPKVLLLDEPTASLDPDVAQYIREFLLEERKKFQVSIILTSHNMAEVEEICDRIIFIDKGRIIADDKPDVLAKTIENCHVDLLVIDGLKRLEQYCVMKCLNMKMEGRYVVVDVKEKNIGKFLMEIAELNVRYDEISIEKPSLEDFFLQQIADIKEKELAKI